MVALSLLCWSIYVCFRYFDLSCNFHPASSNFPPSIPLIFLNFPPSINPLLHALKTELFFPPRVCSSATHLFVHFKKYLPTPKQYISIQQRILAWTNSSRRARRHVWCWVEFHPHHCLRGENGINSVTQPHGIRISLDVKIGTLVKLHVDFTQIDQYTYNSHPLMWTFFVSHMTSTGKVISLHSHRWWCWSLFWTGDKP